MSRWLKPGVIFLCLGLIITGCATLSTKKTGGTKAKNLLKNPDFSEVTENKGPRYWNIQGPAKIVKQEGKNCVSLEGSDWTALTQDVVLKPGKIYEIAFRIKSDYVKYVQIVLDGIKLEPSFGTKKWSYSIHGAFSYYKISNQWTTPTVRFKVASLNDDRVQMTILAEGRKAKEVLISSVSLVEILEAKK